MIRPSARSIAAFLTLVCFALAASAACAAKSTNYVVNGGFENGLTAWHWLVSGKAIATGTLCDTDQWSGADCFRITNRSGFGPNVYGSLQQQVTGLQPNTEYELSAYVRGTDVGNCWFGGGPGWLVRKSLPSGTFDWQRVTITFKTGPDDIAVWPLIVNTDSVTGQLLVDEVAIAQAPGAPVTATVFAPTAISAQGAATVPQIALFPSQYSETGYVESEDLDATCYLPYRVAANEPVRSVSVELARDGEPAALLGTVAVDAQDFQQSVSVRVRLRVPASLLSNGDNVLSVVENDSPSPVASAKFVRQSFADAIAVALRDTRLRLAAVTMDAKRKHLRSNAYVNLGLTVASRFVDRVGRPDIESLQSDYWSFLQLRETEQVLSQTQALIDRPLADVPSVGSSRPKIVNGVFVLQRNGADLPVFYGGYGAFGQVIKDLPTLPSLGATIVQQEAGPNTLDANGIDQGGLARMLDKLKAAHQNGVMVDMLLSPHYFPQWAISQYPDIGIKAHSFIQYDIDHPKAREIIEKWLRTAVSAVKDQPALFSFCLANEPVYVSSGRDVYSKPLFAAYLQREHGSIGNLNSLYKTNYTSFDDVPVPDANVPGFDQPVETMRAYYDWMTFNQQHFADWHTWMNGIIKSIAPSVPTHDKIMAGRVFDRGFLGDGIDPELYEDFTDIAGNDDYASVPGEPTGTANDADYIYGWENEEMSYDLLRSFAHRPVFNSENHLIPDRFTKPVPMAYARSVMWQGALHGQGATVTWVWDEAGGDATSDFNGSVYYRPGSILGAGRAWLDIRRLSPQVAAIVRAKPHVALLYSLSSLYWQRNYPLAAKSAYAALSFLGEPVTFVSEKQLANGTAPAVQVIVLPQATNVSDSTVLALESFVKHGGKLLCLGDGNLLRNQYDLPRNLPADLAESAMSWNQDSRVQQRDLQQALAGVVSLPQLFDAATGRQAFGIEYRDVDVAGKRYVSMVNLTRTDITVAMSIASGKITCPDLLSGDVADPHSIALKPMVPRLVELGE